MAASSLVDANHPGTLLSNVHYDAFGPASFTYGNGVQQNFTHNGRGFLTSANGNNIFNYTLGVAPDGNITSKTVALNSPTVNESWTYTHDEFNRLATAVKAGGNTYAYNYDRYGNRWQQKVNGNLSPGYVFTTTNNRINGSGYSYDALGNVTNDGTHAYTYDAENRMTQVDNGATASYIYDALSRRVRVNAGTNSRECVFDLSGACIAEMATTSGAWLKSDIRALGQTIATYTGSGGTTYFNHSDQIGSLRAQSTVAGAVQTTCTYDPFGSTFNCSGTGSSTRDQFTGDEHDTESGLEHTQFRQLNTLAGRWMSPDPYAGSIDLSNPQSLNRYSYVLNNPLLLTDPLGLCGESGFSITDENDVTTFYSFALCPLDDGGPPEGISGGVFTGDDGGDPFFGGWWPDPQQPQPSGGNGNGDDNQMMLKPTSDCVQTDNSREINYQLYSNGHPDNSLYIQEQVTTATTSGTPYQYFNQIFLGGCSIVSGYQQSGSNGPKGQFQDIHSVVPNCPTQVSTQTFYVSPVATNGTKLAPQSTQVPVQTTDANGKLAIQQQLTIKRQNGQPVSIKGTAKPKPCVKKRG